MKMWSGRFRQPLDPEFEKWQRSFPFDQRLLPFELAASCAHANALEHTGVLSSEELSEIVTALRKIGQRAESEPEFLNDPEAEDVHHFVEKQLAALIGGTGYKLHTGRSRNEQIATDLRLFVRHSIDRLQSLIADWIEALLSRAESAAGSSSPLAMPAYTHLQPAEPVLVAHWLLAYVEMFLRDASRLGDCRKRANLCPLGSGAVAGATLTLNRQAMAAELGFDAPTANSIDATSDRDFAIEFVEVLSLLALHLSRWAEEMILFSTAAYGFVELPEAFSTGSSAMPQKKNPDLLELVRGKAARVLGCAATLQTLMKGLPLAYNKDLQETQEALFNASDTVIGMLPLACFGGVPLASFSVATGYSSVTQSSTTNHTYDSFIEQSATLTADTKTAISVATTDTTAGGSTQNDAYGILVAPGAAATATPVPTPTPTATAPGTGLPPGRHHHHWFGG